MASGIKLTIVLPTQHRISVKIASRETLIRQVLEDACSRKNLEPDRHQLRRNNKVTQKNHCTYFTVLYDALLKLSSNC